MHVQERLLQEVLGQMRIARSAQQIAVQTPRHPVIQLVERRLLAGRVALPRRDSVRIAVFRRLNINAICRTGCCTEKTTDTLLQAVFIAM